MDMAQIHRKVVETPIKSNHVVFYEFFIRESKLLPAVSPRNVKKIELVDPTTTWETKVGSRKRVQFDEGGLEYLMDEAVEVDHKAKKVTYRVLEGNLMMHLYHSLVATLEVKPGTAKWTIEFQKKNELCPDPDIYLQRLDSVDHDVDDHLSPPLPK
ncbi:POLYKETIDE CYCLASE/DEHYDRASE AND LIPID TRANSPORT SUPERFAMILY PROTEIN [Salix purpurea]|uniref:POLYKETIDE CYCLASE/DEHYDRASE AND LIPID TRANSPORT SUPERFAMILY PROTEIN n=1 Tax=Salix purpurea TaxID=77065 RepID=A0A9Q1AD34_SALPP|nr:POLYKETIDE CYCLASE/DEHYDRASE AND LIPID TRANSPORT SUPERFAMILY PROTEIN [Salix purpurea]